MIPLFVVLTAVIGAALLALLTRPGTLRAVREQEPDSAAVELRSLREGLVSGELDGGDYRLLRERLARRLALRRPAPQRADRVRAGWRWPAVAALAAALTAALLVPAVRERRPGDTPTGNDFSEQEALVTGLDGLRAAERAAAAGDLRSATEGYRRALRFFPDKADLRAEYGFALVRSGRRGEGVRQLRLAVLRGPRVASARLYLGAVLMRSAARPEALRQWEAFLRLEPRGPRARFVRRTLQARSAQAPRSLRR